MACSLILSFCADGLRKPDPIQSDPANPLSPVNQPCNQPCGVPEKLPKSTLC
ncbi:hypothetical protein PH5382_00930 [Phaeobacter sp. CECT 5382]|nr:hypothetical protein PH5382_00930 [Phaeobacter sp. CECT 5382]